MSPRNPPAVDRLAGDAAALVKTVTPHDWPHGFAVVPERLPRGLVALACGTGTGIAELYRLRPGVRAVLVDAWKVCKDVGTPTPAEGVFFEASALHEAGHALFATRTTADKVDALLATAGEDVAAYPPGTVARQHGPSWAVALWVMVNRATAFRPRTGAAMLSYVAKELGVYGYPRADLEAAAALVPDNVGLAGALAGGGELAAAVCSRLPNQDTRAAAIVAAGVPCGAAKQEVAK